MCCIGLDSLRYWLCVYKPRGGFDVLNMAYVEVAFAGYLPICYQLPNVKRIFIRGHIGEIRSAVDGVEACFGGCEGAPTNVGTTSRDEGRTFEIRLEFRCRLRIRATGLVFEKLAFSPGWSLLRLHYGSTLTSERSRFRRYFTMYGGRPIPYKDECRGNTTFTFRGRRTQRRCYKALSGIGPHKCERCSLYYCH